MTDRTLFAAGSITKTLVAALVLKLAERDVLELDDRLSRWVPEFPNSRQISVRQLLNHMSGTSDFVEDPAFAAAQERSASAVWTPRRTLRYARDPAREPGVDWLYSSTNYIPRAHAQQRLCASTTEATTAWTAGGMLASAGDLARASDGVFHGSLLNDSSRREMTRFVRTLGEPPEYGLGLGRLELGGEQVWAHTGDIYGFHADLAYLPDQHVTIAALINVQLDAPGQDVLIDRLIREVTKRPRSP